MASRPRLRKAVFAMCAVAAATLVVALLSGDFAPSDELLTQGECRATCSSAFVVQNPQCVVCVCEGRIRSSVTYSVWIAWYEEWEGSGIPKDGVQWSRVWYLSGKVLGSRARAGYYGLHLFV